MTLVYIVIEFEPDTEHEPVDMLKSVLYLKHLQKLFISFTFLKQSNGNGNALLYSCNGNVMHYFKKIK
mgnify:CR=1 FL=1